MTIHSTTCRCAFAMLLALGLIVGCQSTNDHPRDAVVPGSTNSTDAKRSFTPITATTLDGQPFPHTSTSHKATVLIFLLPDCPIANGYAPEIIRLHHDYADKGIRIVLVYCDRDITADKAKAHVKAFGHTCEAVIDPDLSLAALTGATITPEAAVLSPRGAMLYRGRIDDRFPAYGKRRATPTTTELRDALDALLAGEPIAVTRSQAVGCFLDIR